MKKYFFYLCCLIVLLNFSNISVLFAYAAPSPVPKRPPRPPLETPGAIYIKWELLNLTAEQKRRLTTLRYQFQQKAIKLKAQIELKQVEIEQQLIAPNSNPDVVRNFMKEKQTFEADLQMAALENFLAIKALLTPEQLQKLPSAIILK